jgi:hypothetical protein
MGRRLGLELLGAAVALPATACVLTSSLWQEAGREEAGVAQTTSIPCAVLDARQQPPPRQGQASAFSLQMQALRHPEAPRYLDRYAAAPGWMTLRPPSSLVDPDWRTLPGAERLVPTSWDLRVTDAAYFSQPQARARVRFHGFLDPAQVGRILRPAELPAELPAAVPAGALPPHAEERCLDAFAQHDWLSLLLPDSGLRARSATPLAWLDADGAVLPPGAAVDRAHGALLGRLDTAFGPRHVAVPLWLLLHGDDLELARHGDVVRWTRRQIWSAELGTGGADPDALERWRLPLLGDGFLWRYIRLVQPSKVPGYFLAGLLTPAAVACDVLAATNPGLQRLLHYLFGPDQVEPVEIPSSGR